jgi:hypothetical protein
MQRELLRVMGDDRSFESFAGLALEIVDVIDADSTEPVPKPLTAVNREFLFAEKSRIYLYCGEAITHAARVIKSRNAGQFCGSL